MSNKNFPLKFRHPLPLSPHMVIMISVWFVSYLAVQSCLQIEKAIRILRESLFFQKTIDSTVMLTQYLKYCSWNEKKFRIHVKTR